MISTDNKIVSRMVGRARPRGEGTGAGGADTGPGEGVGPWDAAWELGSRESVYGTLLSCSSLL